jgi:hypothetical protein
MQTIPEHELQFRFKSGKVDVAAGILRDVTVAKAGVIAEGKYLYLDKAGQPTRDPAAAVQRLAVTTDETTLDTLLAAVKDAGGKLRVRSDHDDALSARAGYATNFRKTGDLVICDIHLLDSYRDRGQVLEVSNETPELIGMSIDFEPSFFISKNSAAMRVEEIYAVDIVDAGAITPNGLYLSRGKVDKEPKDNPTKISMAKDDKTTAPTIEDCMAQIKALADQHGEMKEMLAKFAQGNPPKKAEKDDEKGSSNKEKGGSDPVEDDDSTDELKADMKEMRDQLSKTMEAFTAFQKSQSALGLKQTAKTEGGADSAAEAERIRLAAEKDKGQPKTYLQLMKEKKSDAKYKSVHERHAAIMQEAPEAYARHIKGFLKERQVA